MWPPCQDGKARRGGGGGGGRRRRRRWQQLLRLPSLATSDGLSWKAGVAVGLGAALRESGWTREAALRSVWGVALHAPSWRRDDGGWQSVDAFGEGTLYWRFTRRSHRHVRAGSRTHGHKRATRHTEPRQGTVQKVTVRSAVLACDVTHLMLQIHPILMLRGSGAHVESNVPAAMRPGGRAGGWSTLRAPSLLEAYPEARGAARGAVHAMPHVKPNVPAVK